MEMELQLKAERSDRHYEELLKKKERESEVIHPSEKYITQPSEIYRPDTLESSGELKTEIQYNSHYTAKNVSVKMPVEQTERKSNVSSSKKS